MKRVLLIAGKLIRQAQPFVPGTIFVTFLLFAEPLARLRGSLYSFCLFEHFIGIPCPGCGVTRAIIAIRGGSLGTAWALNPVAFPVVSFFVFSLVLAAGEVAGRISRSAAARGRLIADRALCASALALWTIRVLSSQMMWK